MSNVTLNFPPGDENPFGIRTQEELEELVRRTHTDEREVPKSGDREYAQVSMTASWGPLGGNMHGWITYASSKIYFVATETRNSGGLYAGGGVHPLNSVLKHDLIAGKTGTFKIWMDRSRDHTRYFQMWVDDKPVLSIPIVLVGVGVGDGMEGRVRF